MGGVTYAAATQDVAPRLRTEKDARLAVVMLPDRGPAGRANLEQATLPGLLA